jgi:peptide deformylase
MKNLNGIKLVFHPNKILLTPCKPIEINDKNQNFIKQILKEMKFTMQNITGFYEDNCLGLAANQIGYNYKIMIISKYPKIEKLKNKVVDVIINPEITYFSDVNSLKWEGCISDKKNMLLIQRPEIVKIKYIDENFVKNEKLLGAIQSRIVQHEIDHLNGIDMYERNIIDKIAIKTLEENDKFYGEWFEDARKRNFFF